MKKNFPKTILHRILIGSFLIFAASPVHAQSYTHVSGGSSFYCAHLPNGKTAVVERTGRRYSTVPYATASKESVKARNQYRKRIATLNSLKQHVTENADRFNPAQVILFAKAFKEYSNGTLKKLPTTNADKLKLLDSIITKTTVKLNNTQAEIDGLKVCHDNKPHPISLDSDIKTISSPDGTVVAVVLLIFVPDDPQGVHSTGLNYCVKKNGDPVGSAQLQGFSTQPCSSLPSCGNVVPKHELADIIYQIDYPFGADSDEIASAENQLVTIAGSGYQALYTPGNCSQF